MKIAIVSSHAPTLLDTQKELITRLVSEGHELFVLAPFDTPEVQEQIESLGVEASTLPISRRGLNPFAEIGSLLHTKQVLFRIKPDIILSTGFKAIVYGSMAARMAWVGHKKRVLALVTSLGYAFTRDSGLLRRIYFNIAKGMYRSGFRACDTIMFLSEDDKDFFQKLDVLPDHATLQVLPEADRDNAIIELMELV